jgi:hypothetical protein
MAFSKITRIILYVVAGISILVMAFYYIGPKTLDYDALELKVEDATAQADLTPATPLPTNDTTAQDSTMAGGMAVAESNQGGGGAFGTAKVIDTSNTNMKELLSGWEYLVWFCTDIALIWAYILVIITMIVSIVFPLLHVFSNPRGLVRLLLVLAGAAVIVIISYLLSNDTPIEILGYNGTSNSDPTTLKLIDTVLFITYMLFGLALASILYAIVSRAFK